MKEGLYELEDRTEEISHNAKTMTCKKCKRNMEDFRLPAGYINQINNLLLSHSNRSQITMQLLF